MKPGARIYIRATFGINVVLVVLLLLEAARTRLWKGLRSVDYMDPAHLILNAISPVEPGLVDLHHLKDSSLGLVQVSREPSSTTKLHNLSDRANGD